MQHNYLAAVIFRASEWFRLSCGTGARVDVLTDMLLGPLAVEGEGGGEEQEQEGEEQVQGEGHAF